MISNMCEANGGQRLQTDLMVEINKRYQEAVENAKVLKVRKEALIASFGEVNDLVQNKHVLINATLLEALTKELQVLTDLMNDLGINEVETNVFEEQKKLETLLSHPSVTSLEAGLKRVQNDIERSVSSSLKKVEEMENQKEAQKLQDYELRCRLVQENVDFLQDFLKNQAERAKYLSQLPVIENVRRIILEEHPELAGEPVNITSKYPPSVSMPALDLQIKRLETLARELKDLR